MSLAVAFLYHYLDYITGPTVLLTITLGIVPVLYLVKLNTQIETGVGISGCRRLGRRGGLPGQPSSEKFALVHPILNCPGIELSASTAARIGSKLNGLFALGVRQPVNDKTGKLPAWHVVSEAYRLAQLEIEIWLPDPGLSTPKSSVTQAQPGSGDRPTIRRSGSRNRQDTLTLESAGVDADALLSSPPSSGNEEWASQGGCLIIRFPAAPNLLTYSSQSAPRAICIPLSPTRDRAAAKGYGRSIIQNGDEGLVAFDMGNEINASMLHQLKHFLGPQKANGECSLFRLNREEEAQR